MRLENVHLAPVVQIELLLCASNQEAVAPHIGLSVAGFAALL